MINKGILFVVSGPSGVGKSTILKKILTDFKESMIFSISCTTRQKRELEIDGVDYFFIDEQEFENRIKNNEFLEWAKVHTNYYGTPKKWLDSVLETGKDVILDIDVQGAENLKNMSIPAVFVFIAPPSFEELENRIRNRHTDSEESIQKRLENARKELAKMKMYDYVIKNDVLDSAIAEFKNIIFLEKQKN
jgi:guanylate kinase